MQHIGVAYKRVRAAIESCKLEWEATTAQELIDKFALMYGFHVSSAAYIYCLRQQLRLVREYLNVRRFPMILPKLKPIRTTQIEHQN